MLVSKTNNRSIRTLLYPIIVIIGKRSSILCKYVDTNNNKTTIILSKVTRADAKRNGYYDIKFKYWQKIFPFIKVRNHAIL